MEQYSIGFLRCTSNSVHGPYFIHVISFVSVSHALRAHSMIYFYERGGGLLERGLIYNFCLKRGPIRDEGLIELL